MLEGTTAARSVNLLTYTGLLGEPIRVKGRLVFQKINVIFRIKSNAFWHRNFAVITVSMPLSENAI